MTQDLTDLETQPEVMLSLRARVTTGAPVRMGGADVADLGLITDKAH